MSTVKQSISYIERDLEIIDSITSSLQAIAENDPSDERVFNLFGLVGIGKTYALQQVFDTFKATHRVIWLSFDGVESTEPGQQANAQLALVKMSWVDAIKRLSDLPELQNFIPTQVELEDNLRVDLEHMGALQLASTGSHESKKPLLLLLDALDNLPYWKWLQEQIIKPLVDQKRVAIVCASRTPLFWHFWEVRECCTASELSPFTEKETRQFLAQTHREPIAVAVHTAIGGYPLALREFVTMLDSSNRLLNATDIAEPDFSPLDQATIKVVKQIGVMRRVHTGIMMQLLKAAGSSFSKDELVLLLQKLRFSGFIHNETDSLRRFTPQLRAWVKHLIDAAEYQQCCVLIAKNYHKMAIDEPLTDVAAIMDWLYFSIEDYETMGEAERTEWKNQLTRLGQNVDRLRQADPTNHIPPSFMHILYLDGELLAKLVRLDLLPLVRNVLAKQIDDRQIVYGREIARACSRALKTIGRRFMNLILDDAVSFETALRGLALQSNHGGLEQGEVHQRVISEWPTIENRPTRSRNELLAALSGDSIVHYDRQQRIYKVNSVVDKLLAVEQY